VYGYELNRPFSDIDNAKLVRRKKQKPFKDYEILSTEESKTYPPNLIEWMYEVLQLSFQNTNHRLHVLLEELESQKRAQVKIIPDGFICPITKDIIRDPVIFVFDGHSYEQKAIEDWLEKSNWSPLTNEVLPEGYGGIVLVENYALKSARPLLILPFIQLLCSVALAMIVECRMNNVT
jgi:predicted nucleotidyltransferase